jgi:uncharacterized protein (TIGR02594 family)
MTIFKRGTVQLEAAPNTTPWMAVVLKEVGVSEVPGDGDNARILEYHAATSLHASKDSVAWCSAFANWVFKQVGIKGTDSAAALSWRTWGKKIDLPRYGCVVVFDHGSGHGHVTFFIREEGGYLVCTGGNQGDAVRESKYGRGELSGFRWPA